VTPAVLLLLAASVDPCTAEPTTPSGDPREAEIYLRVGLSEHERGNDTAAAEAFRAALARNPNLAEAQRGLQAACSTPLDPVEAGSRLLRAGKPEAALPYFQEARRRGPNPNADLLAGICHFQLGQDAAALPLLESARKTPELADSASLFLGLIALRAGNGARAERLLDVAARTPGLEDRARELARAAQREGHLVFSALGQLVYDTNAALRPDEALAGIPGPDGSAALNLLALVRPLGASGPYLRGEVQLSKQFTLSQFDLIGGGAALGARLAGETGSVFAEYGYAYEALGGSPFLAVHHLLTGGALRAGPLVLGGAYAANFESYRTSDLSDQSGVRHALELDVGWPVSRALRLTVGWIGGLDQAKVDPLSYFENGPVAEIDLFASGAVQFGLRGGVLWRNYRTEDPSYGYTRADTRFDAVTWGEVALDSHWAVRGTVRLLRVNSNVPDLNATEWVFTASLSWVGVVL
jgi:tetratricopeptide (TPR) repeat protein